MTRINATLLSKEKFEAKQKELEQVVGSLNIYGNTEQAEKAKDEIKDLYDDLNRNLYALDCAYLDAKLQTFTKVLDLIKE